MDEAQYTSQVEEEAASDLHETAAEILCDAEGVSLGWGLLPGFILPVSSYLRNTYYMPGTNRDSSTSGPWGRVYSSWGRPARSKEGKRPGSLRVGVLRNSEAG